LAICPNCGKQISFLKNYVYNSVVEYNFNGSDYEFVDCHGGDLEEFCCPECGYKIIEDEQQAKKFLSG